MSSKIISFLKQNSKFKNLLNELQNQKKVNIFRPAAGGLHHLLSNISRAINKNIIFITDSNIEDIATNLNYYSKIYKTNKIISSLSSLYNSPYRVKSPPFFNQTERLRTFYNIRTSEQNFIVTDILSFFFPLPQKKDIHRYILELNKSQKIAREEVEAKIKQFDYKYVDIVNYSGEYSVRGHIIDIFPFNCSLPVRIDFEGDEIFSINYFKPSSQLTVKQVDKIKILSTCEFLFPEEKKKIKPLAAKRWDKFHLRNKFKELNAHWKQGLYYPGEENFRILIQNNTLFDYFNDYMIILDSINPQEQINKIRERWSTHEQKEYSSGLYIEYNHFLREEIINKIFQQQIKFFKVSPENKNNTYYFSYQPLSLKKDDPLTYIKKNKKEQLVLFIKDKNKEKSIFEKIDPKIANRIYFSPYYIERGFRYKNLYINFIPTKIIFPEATRASTRDKIKPFLSKFQDLKPGDTVVHSRYGIARFNGITKEKINGVSNDFIVLEYAGGDKVFVDIRSLDLIYRYSGVENYTPPLDRLGSKNWIRTKEKVKKGIFKIAKDLLSLYAKRKTNKGIKFTPEPQIEKEFLELFEYEPTKDQEIAWKEISEDMKKDKPMDRLLCGDVGFGKTEVAMRAAFRAILNNKQVAVLCPTTILADQHYRTFKQRFKYFPAHIALYSRMVSYSKKKKTREQLKKGKIDILIGTHSILYKKVNFKNLGLLIVDEEQRFGVKHKNRIVKLKEKIDVLTMTATPIPRTLNMALSSVKDLSIIETPPPGRISIATYVEKFNSEIIKQAIENELNRNGQIYIVYNNIQGIKSFKSFINKLAPEARTAYLHSRMKNSLIEDTMMDFINKKLDILVSTTIIENGIDIENVNTLIVVNAENFGLSQLYQLRGRVGRGKRKAYAYFLIPGEKLLTGKAKKRLKALYEFQELGSGFRLAAMDLEIRGAGNLLGKEQHGHIKSVGFEYYLWLLNRAIKNLKGEEEEEISTEINLPFAYSIPENYIPQSSQRLNIYKRLSSIKSLEKLNKIKDEIKDRFGNFPFEIHNLIFIVRVRILSLNLKIEKISYNKSNLKIRFSPLTKVTDQTLKKITKKYNGEIEDQWEIKLNLKKDKNLKQNILNILNRIIKR